MTGWDADHHGSRAVHEDAVSSWDRSQGIVQGDADGALPFGVSSASPEGAAAVSLAKALDDYNNGLIGPGHCE